MAKIGIGLDLGAHSAKVVVGQMKKDDFLPLDAAVVERANGAPYDLAALLNARGIKGSAILGVTGKEMIIRYTQVTPMPDWQLKQVMGFEIDDLAAQSGGGLSADFNRLTIASSLSEDDSVLLALIKDSLLEDRIRMLEGTKVEAGGFTPNAIALYNLLVRTADVESGTSLILNIGAENMDLTIIQDGAIIFARNLSGGSNLFNKALMDSFNVRNAKAEMLKKEMGCIITRATPDGLSPQEEKIGRSLSGTAGQIYSMIQSSLMFCKAQIKVADLSPDRVYLTGGGARLRGLDAYLSDNLHIPVKRYDPADALDITQLKDPEELTSHGPELSCALGLALMSATPDHYSIQVLPEAVKKRQFFKNHVLFGILAAVLLLIFLGFKVYVSTNDAAVLNQDISKRKAELKRRERIASEIENFQEENARYVSNLNLLEQKIIPATGLVRTFALIQKYLSDDLWITSIEIVREDLEELGTGNEKRPMVRIRGSGREMDQSLQKSFTDFRKRLEADPFTDQVVPQVRYGDNFSFSLLVNYTRINEEEAGAERGEEEEDGEG